MTARSIHWIAGLAVLGLVSGCITVLPETEPPTHLVRVPAPDQQSPGELDQRVLIHEPDASGALAGAEIAAARDGAIVYINNVRWADAPSRQLQAALVDKLAQATGDGWAAAVESGARGDFELRWTIRDLSYDMNAQAGVCDLRLTLLAVRSRNIVASDRIRTSVASVGGDDADRARAVAAAMTQASETAADFVVNYATSYNLPARRKPRKEEDRGDRRRPSEPESASF